MKTRNFLVAALLGTTGFAAHLLDPSLASAQSSTTGAIQGQVKDAKSKEPLAGVTVIATSPALAQTQTAITDENGSYKIYGPARRASTWSRSTTPTSPSSGAASTSASTKSVPVFQLIDQAAAGGEVVHITATAPTIDPTSTTQGITIDQNYIKNIPVPGRTFEAALGAAAGSQNDGLGVSFSGSSSLENQYYVDGVNTTGLTFGTVGSPVINDFIQEIEVITGGYNAEYGRATGGVVNVVTKSGSNEFKGSIFGYFTPGQLTAAAETHAGQRLVDRRGRQHGLQRRLRLRARRSDHQGQAVVLRRLRAAVRPDRLHAHDQAPDRLPHRRRPDERDPRGRRPGLSACDKQYADATAGHRSADRLLHHR